jgi:MurNAc alpha-1-phosphate uridylyltransferase
MIDQPKRALILAAGLGVRMRPLTDARPKPLLAVGGRSLAGHCLDRLKEAGVTDVIVNVHYLADQLIAHLKTRKDLNVTIQDERDALLDTGGAMVRARHFFQEKPFFVLNSDSIWIEGMGSNLKRLAHHWDDAAMDCLILLAPTYNAIGYDGQGDFTMDANGRLARREYRRVAPFAMPGAQLIHPRFLDDAPQGPFSTNLLWDRAIEAGRLFGLRLDGRWMHVGTPEALGEAEDYLREMHGH